LQIDGTGNTYLGITKTGATTGAWLIGAESSYNSMYSWTTQSGNSPKAFRLVMGSTNALVVDTSSNVNVAKNLTVDGNVYYEMPHLFGIADTTQPLLVLNTWQAIDFNFLLGDSYGFTANDSNGIVVSQTGHYFATFEVQFSDTSPLPTANAGIRITLNGVEISGSYSEVDFTKQNSDTEITTIAYVEATQGDVLMMEFISDDLDVSVTSDNTWSKQNVVAKGFINWVHP